MEKEKNLEKLMDEYVEKYCAQVAQYRDFDKKAIERGLDILYGLLEVKRPKETVYKRSPVEAWTYICDRFNLKDRRFVAPYLEGIFDNAMAACIDFSNEHENVDFSGPEFEIYKNFTTTSGIYPLDEVAVIIGMPTKVIQNAEHNLHNPTGPAVEYADGLKFYFLDGHSVPEWIEKPIAEWNKEEVLKVSNTDARREILKLLGVNNLEKFFDSKTLDKLTLEVGGYYELIEIEAFGRGRKFLKMENASHKGLWHIEGVPNDCNSVLDALKFRNGTDVLPLVIT